MLYYNTLEHHGKLGMHWGVHRTEAQLASTKSKLDSGSNIVKETKNINSAVSNIASTAKLKKNTLTDQELKERVSRMMLEQQYAQLSKPMETKGQAYIKNTLEVAGSALAIAGSITGIALSIKQLKG